MIGIFFKVNCYRSIQVELLDVNNQQTVVKLVEKDLEILDKLQL